MTAGVVLVVDAYSGFGGFAGHSRSALLLHRLSRFRAAQHDRAGDGASREGCGSASALLGTLQFVLGALAGSLISAFANGTPVPMAAVVAGCGATAFLTNRFVE